MGRAIGEMLPLALGIAISPMPIVFGIRALLSPRAKAISSTFLAGWLAGIVIALVLFTLLASIALHVPKPSRPIVAIINIVIGALVLVLAVREARSRPDAAAEPRMPIWMSLTPWRGLRAGFGGSALHPTNILFGSAAGTVLGAAALTVAQDVIAVAVFTVIAGFTVWVPIIIHVVAPKATAELLGSLREWSLRSNTGVRAVVLLIMGVFLVGNGIGAL